MIPKINDQGHSFKGVVAYLVHDKEGNTSERLSWTHTENLYTNDPEKAAKVMAWTDMNSEDIKRAAGGSLAGGKPTTGSVYHYSLSWATDENPSEDHQREHALQTLEALGLQDHQAMLFAHNDTDHAHVHVVVNLTHPETGKRAHLSWDQRQIQKWALAYEKDHGIKCQQRLENAKEYEQGKSTKYRDKKQDYSHEVTRAFSLSDNGKAFVQALKVEGLELAPAHRGKGFVIVDHKGDIQPLHRQLDPVDKYHTPITHKAKGALMRDRLKDLDPSTLPHADQLSAQRKAEYEQKQAEIKAASEIFDKEADELSRQEKFAKAAVLHAQLEQKFLEEERSEVLTKWRKDKQDLAVKRGGLVALNEYYRAIDTQKEEDHRKHWETAIASEEKEKARLEDIRDNSWLYSFVYKVRHGQSIDKGVEAQDKNIENAKMRLEEGVGGLTGGQKRELLARNLDLDDEDYLLEIRINKELAQAQENAKIRAQKAHETPVSEVEKDLGQRQENPQTVDEKLREHYREREEDISLLRGISEEERQEALRELEIERREALGHSGHDTDIDHGYDHD